METTLRIGNTRSWADGLIPAAEGENGPTLLAVLL